MKERRLSAVSRRDEMKMKMKEKLEKTPKNLFMENINK